MSRVAALHSKTYNYGRTYSATIERRFLHKEHRLLQAKKTDAKNRARWTDEEWIKLFKGIGRTLGAYKLYITIQYRRHQSISKARKCYWDLMVKSGLINKPPYKK